MFKFTRACSLWLEDSLDISRDDIDLAEDSNLLDDDFNFSNDEASSGSRASSSEGGRIVYYSILNRSLSFIAQ